jgi:RNA recognition motif-containing protein
MLENEFSKFGDVIDAIIMKNNETGQSRGFGFITYRDPKSATLAANTINKVDGKTVCFFFQSFIFQIQNLVCMLGRCQIIKYKSGCTTTNAKTIE